MYPQVEADIKLIKAEGVDVRLGEMETKATCEKADLMMAVGKMVTSLIQLGGHTAPCAPLARKSATACWSSRLDL